MSIPQAIILGVIQGIAEWLPVSSSGHLVIAQEFFSLQNSMFFDIMLHIATLLVVFIVFWRDIKEIVKALLKRDFSSEYGKLAIYIIIGSIPTGIIGFLFCDTFEKMFSNLQAVAVALMATGVLLLSTVAIGTRHCLVPTTKDKDWKRKIKELNGKISLLIGIAQGIAIIPGISRSGSTISAGILLGIDKEKAARFSFLLSIPAIIGAMIFKFKEVENLFNGTMPVFIGMISAMIAGYITLKFLLKIIKSDKFYLFGYYCIILSIFVIITLVL